MAKVSAVIMIYDIRGFTSASKKLPTADLGAFADAAHRAILGQFNARRADFIKNLGDGHLMIWETTVEPEAALVKFVVDASSSARKDFPAFVAEHLDAQGIAGLVFPTRIGFGVATGEVSKSDDYYGKAVNLAARLQNMARPEGLALCERSFAMAGDRAAMQRRGFKCTKASLKGLGTVPVWTDRPFSWGRFFAALTPLFIAVLLPLLYVMLADADPKDRLPGGDAIQRWLDSRDMSLFRPVRSDAKVRAAAHRMRGAIAKAIVAVRHEDGRIATSLQSIKDDESSVWGSSQAIAGLLSIPNLAVAEKRELVMRYADGIFRDGEFIKDYGWRVLPDRDYTLCEPVCWTIVLLARAIATPGLLQPGERENYMERLAKAQASTAIYRPLANGGWNIFPNQKHLDHFSPYSTALGLLALLETRAAGLPWAGSVPERDALLKRTAEFLLAHYTRRGESLGWQRTSAASEPISEGLTLQLYAELMRAEELAGIVLPAEMTAELPRHLELLSGRRADNPDDAGEYIESFRSHTGADLPGTESINFIWHSWAVETAVRWLARTKKFPAPHEDIVAVRRALGVLVVDMEAGRTKTAVEGQSFIGGETLLGLSVVPAP
ncbi:MAG: adenylate/guanylate cyclase domain-containing protein [Verrucomicrobia bacterium]|nr:adenylate/guanylate cyclase domain-containing protein [Verrucomicrobiota bacterium]